MEKTLSDDAKHAIVIRFTQTVAVTRIPKSIRERIRINTRTSCPVGTETNVLFYR
jgi:hypothetical protein